MPDALHFAATSRIHRAILSERFQRKTIQLLSSFHLNAIRFLKLMKTTHAVISGSAVLLPLLSATFVPGDLDVYVPVDHAMEFIKELKKTFHYQTATDSNGKPRKVYLEGDQEIKRVKYYMKRGKLINVIIVRGDNALVPIFSFHSTPVMNFISYYGIFCAYPELTLAYRGIINNTRPPSADLKKRYKKLKDRGFSLGKAITDWPAYDGHVCMSSKVCPQTARSLYDGGSMFFPFPKIQKEDDHKLIYNGLYSVVWSLDAGQVCKNQNPVTQGFSHSVSIVYP